MPYTGRQQCSPHSVRPLCLLSDLVFPCDDTVPKGALAVAFHSVGRSSSLAGRRHFFAKPSEKTRLNLARGMASARFRNLGRQIHANYFSCIFLSFAALFRNSRYVFVTAKNFGHSEHVPRGLIFLRASCGLVTCK